MQGLNTGGTNGVKKYISEEIIFVSYEKACYQVDIKLSDEEMLKIYGV